MSCVFVYNEGLSLPKERYHIETRGKSRHFIVALSKRIQVDHPGASDAGRSRQRREHHLRRRASGRHDQPRDAPLKKRMSDTSYEKMLLVMCEQTDWIWHFFYCCMEFFQRTDGQNLLSTWYQCRITRVAGEHEGCRSTIPWLYPCLALFHVPTQPENHTNQVSAVFSFWSYCTQRWERMRSTNVNMVDRSPGSAWKYHHIIGWFLELRPGRGIGNILVKPLIPLHIRMSLLSFGSGGATALQDKETGKCTGWTKKRNCKRCPEVFCNFSQLSHGKCCSGCCDRVRKRHWLRELHWPRIGAKSYSSPQQLPLLGPGSRAVGTGRKMPETLDSNGCLLRVIVCVAAGHST